MKRCPQCEFIYEDDQSLCDMDGVLLVLDARTLPNLHALETIPAKSQRRNRAVPAFATLILTLVLAAVYYVSTQRNTYPPATTSSTSSAAATVADPAPTQPPAAESKSPVETAREEPKAVVAKPAAVIPAKKAPGKTAPVPQQKSEEKKKEESKVGSILKKTGRILKKPFKF